MFPLKFFKDFSYQLKKFGEMMHSTMEQIAFKMAMLGQFLRVPQNFEIFHDRRFWVVLRDDVTALTI